MSEPPAVAGGLRFDRLSWVFKDQPPATAGGSDSNFGGGAGNRTRIQKPTPKDSTCLAVSLFVRLCSLTSFARFQLS